MWGLEGVLMSKSRVSAPIRFLKDYKEKFGLFEGLKGFLFMLTTIVELVT